MTIKCNRSLGFIVLFLYVFDRYQFLEFRDEIEDVENTQIQGSNTVPGTEFITNDHTRHYKKVCLRYLKAKNKTELKVDTINELKTVVNAQEVRIFHEKNSTIKIDTHNNIAYCLQPKAGTTNWSKLALAIKQNITFSEINGELHTKAVYSHNPTINQIGRKALNLGINGFNFRYQNIDKLDIKYGVLLTRHPLTRLYSCWSHRLSNSEKIHWYYFQGIVEHIRKHYSEDTDVIPPNGIFVSFTSFLRFVSSNEAHYNSKFYNQHWAKAADLCFACELEFWNNIVETETSERDAEELLENIGYSHVGKLPRAYGGENEYGKGEARKSQAWKNEARNREGVAMGNVRQKADVDVHFNEIRSYIQENVPSTVVLGVYEQYFWDFELFGYDLDGFL